MNFNLYLFGNPDGRYSQIPDDYLGTVLAPFQNDLKGSRLVIMRKMDLVHYVYFERISESKFIGICLIFNRAYAAHPKQLVALFRDVIEDYLVKKGDIIRYSKEGELQFVVKTFGENPLRHQKLHDLIREKFENSGAQYGITPLKSTFNGEHTSRVINFSTEEKQIVAMTTAYNTLIVDDTEGLEQGYIPQVIGGLNETINQLKEQNNNLQIQNATLNRQKKQMRWILLLLSLLIVGGIIFYYYAQNKKQVIQTKSDEIVHLNSVVADKDDQIEYLDDNIRDLRSELGRLSRALTEKTNQFDEVKQKLSDLNYELNNNISAYVYFEYSWRSTNYQNNSSSSNTYTLHACKGDELNISYYVSSEYNYDWLTISIRRKGYSATQLVRVSGSQSDTYVYHISATGVYELTATYSKDQDGARYNDNAGISGLYLYRPIIEKLRDMSTY